MTFRQCLRMIAVTWLVGMLWTGVMLITVAKFIPGDSVVLAGLLGLTASPVGVVAAVWNELRRT